ncbi:MAG: O-antigen ligase domain-containing protein, partial [Bacteroidetes bacterium]|nr:O-antigen ligase domain-containing protein [Bacteroidota bacterium]
MLKLLATDIKKIITLLLIMPAVIFLAYLIAAKGIMIAVAGIILPVVIFYLISLFKKPEIGLWTLFVVNYFILGLTRYIPQPLGLSIDSLLVLTHVAVFVRFFFNKEIYSRAKSDLLFVSAIWYLYALFQLVNPEAVSREAWFYAMRGVSLHMFLIIPLVFMLADKYRNLKLFLHLWMVFALIGILKGLMQKFIGPDPWEQRWLDSGGALTHLLFGKLRIFSFFTDAGQFGAATGHAGVVFAILAMNVKSMKHKWIYTVAALLFFYGMIISGTRGAIAVPVGGFLCYIILKKNIKMIISGSIVGALLYVFFFHTSIGQGNYDINRMRTAFDKDNPSLQVRFENQKKLKSYMTTRPFGGGIGSSGNWGQRFSPTTFLANTPTDSWYVMIWAEQGIIGLLLHLGILFFILFRSAYMIWFRLKDPWLIAQMQGLTAGFFGIMLASYGNGVLGQMPTG